MRTTLFCASIALAFMTAPALAGEGPTASARLAPGAAPAGPAHHPIADARPTRQGPDPQACAALCRLFEFMGALERRKPADPVPTS